MSKVYKIFQLERHYNQGVTRTIRKEPKVHELGRLFSSEAKADKAIIEHGRITVRYEVVPIRQI